MGLSLRGTTSGAVDINAPAVAGDNTITLPNGNGSANQFFKNSDIAGIITHSSMTESSSGVISIGDIDIDGTTRTITTGVGQTVGFSTDIKIQGSVRIEDPSVSASRLAITYQGIDFQNTGAGSSTTSTSHMLDDYEEGTWSCTLNPSSGFTPTNNTVTGYYTKVGRQITAVAIATMDTPVSLGSYVNDNTGFGLTISGLPFITINDIQARSAPVIGVFDDIQTPNGQLTGHGSSNSTSINLFVSKDNGSTRTSPTLPTSQTCNCHLSFTYFTSQ